MSPPDPVRISLHRDGGYAALSVRGLTEQRYREYRCASEGARYVPRHRTSLAPLDKVPGILTRLRDFNFDVDMEPRLIRVLQEQTAQQWLDLKAAQERIARIDDELFKQDGNRMYPFQRTGALWLTLRQAGLLADDPGLGKTLTTIVAIPQGVPVLVVAPAVAKGVWRGEMRKWRPRLKTATLVGRDSFRWPRDGEMLITNYEILPNIHDPVRCDGKLPPERCPGCAEAVRFEGKKAVRDRIGHLPECTGFLEPRDCPGCHPLLKHAPPGMVLVADEAHYLKGSKTNRTLKFRAISEAVRAKEGRVWLLTGTPLENETSELWSVLKAAGLAEEAFGSWNDFVALFRATRQEVEAPINGGGLPDDGIRERLQRVSLRRMKVDVMPELPTKVWRNYEVELDKKTIRSLDALLSQTGRSTSQIVALLEKEEIGFEFMSAVRAALAFAKIPAMTALVEQFEEEREPLIVFSAHRAPIDTLAKRPGWAVITGDVSADKRKELEEKFQRGELKGLGLTIRAGGVAITLTRACNALFVDRDFKPTANLQAEDRLVRIGQTRGCIITTLVANHPLDERVTEILLKKTRLIQAAIDVAATDDDAPQGEPKGERIFEERLHRTQEEIACGRAVRHMAETPEEKKALEDLHTIRFATRNDERVGLEFMADAQAIGLSRAQWEWVIDIVARGKTPEEVRSRAEEIVSRIPSAKVEVETDTRIRDEEARLPPRSSARSAGTLVGGWAARRERRRQGGSR